MNKKIKKKLVKQINRQIAGKTCQFFLFGNDNCEGSFRHRLKQFGIDVAKCSSEIDDWFIKTPNNDTYIRK